MSDRSIDPRLSPRILQGAPDLGMEDELRRIERGPADQVESVRDRGPASRDEVPAEGVDPSGTRAPLDGV